MGKTKRGKLDTAAFLQFVEEFKNESDRAAVVLGAAKLDLILYQLFQLVFLPPSTGRDELLDGDSPLGTFSAKINMAYRLGLIDAEYARALHLVRKIRNSFAHEVSGCSLTSGAHCDRVKELTLPLKKFKNYHTFKEMVFGEDEGPEYDFRVTLAVMVARLEKHLARVDQVSSATVLPLIREDWEEVPLNPDPKKKKEDSQQGAEVKRGQRRQ